MMYPMLAEDRKQMVRRIGELSGIKPRYRAAPTYSYEIGDIYVLRDGTVTCREENSVINALIEEGWIQGPEKEAERSGYAVTVENPDPEMIHRLLVIMHARGRLIRHATDGEFYVSKVLMDTLKEEAPIRTLEDLQVFIDNSGEEDKPAVLGVEFSGTEIRFTGFPETDDPDIKAAYLHFSQKLVEMAAASTRVLDREPQEENEKFAMRVWLIRLGMSGEAYKRDRKILLMNLAGDSAWRTEKTRRKSAEKPENREKE